MRTLALSCALLLVAGCHKPKPSLEYIEASGRYTSLTAELGDDAYADAEMTRLEDLLHKVPADSLDAQKAAELLATIAGERKAHRRRGRRQREGASPGRCGRVRRAAGRTPAEAASPDGGPSNELTRGMSVDEMRRTTDNCFSSSGPMKVRNADKAITDAEMFERVDSTRCRERFAKYEGRFLVFKDGHLFGDYEKAALAPLNVPGQQPPAPQPTPPAPVVEPGGDQPPTPQQPPPTPGDQTGPPPPARSVAFFSVTRGGVPA